jgi:hypothetical protein
VLRYRHHAAGANTVSGAVADITLTNPMSLYQNISFAVPGKKIILPPMNAPTSVPIGVPFVFEAGGGNSYDIYYQDGVTKVMTIGGIGSAGSEKAILGLTNNSTANGSIKVAALIPPNPSVPSVHGVSLQNNATTPATKIDVIIGGGGWAEYVDVNGSSIGMGQAFGFTVDAGLAGPVANGRDQPAAFAASQWLHIYAIIGRGQAPAGIISANPPSFVPVPPALPSGYTHAPYLTSVFWNGLGNFLRFHQLDDRVSYDGRQVALNAGAATVDTAVSLSTLVPLQAIDFDLNIESWGVTADGTGAAISVLHLGFLAGTDTHQLVADFAVSPSTATRIPTGDITFPNVSQQFYYHHQLLNGSAPSATAVLRSYRVPNGAQPRCGTSM